MATMDGVLSARQTMVDQPEGNLTENCCRLCGKTQKRPFTVDLRSMLQDVELMPVMAICLGADGCSLPLLPTKICDACHLMIDFIMTFVRKVWEVQQNFGAGPMRREQAGRETEEQTCEPQAEPAKEDDMREASELVKLEVEVDVLIKQEPPDGPQMDLEQLIPAQILLAEENGHVSDGGEQQHSIFGSQRRLRQRKQNAKNRRSAPEPRVCQQVESQEQWRPQPMVPPLNYQCNVCERTLPNEKAYRIHIVEHFPSSVEWLARGKPLLERRTRGTKQRQLTHSVVDPNQIGRTNGRLYCDTCGERFSHKYMLSYHKMKQHSKENLSTSSNT